jgi:hypothetical protein
MEQASMQVAGGRRRTAGVGRKKYKIKIKSVGPYDFDGLFPAS